MLYKILKTSAMLLLTLWLNNLQAQEVIPVAGGNASGSGGTASYTVGQVVYSIFSGSNGYIVQGVQQPFEISVISEIDEIQSISLKCSTYPNPTDGFLTLRIENYQADKLTYLLYDINGKVIESKKVVSNETIIVMSNLSSATYILRVIQDNKEVKTFKIIKN